MTERPKGLADGPLKFRVLRVMPEEIETAMNEVAEAKQLIPGSLIHEEAIIRLTKLLSRRGAPMPINGVSHEE